ncbi:hypothetical protein AVEN_258363-1 [Araneus ventricosus]|uniref:Uncharacterized protein n=1 Tax=Araneus ventricosus TaxID=182803 RepID=A0A4Y2FAS5_ARAVE|nr:hypothetical protein AVEN_258363-1 [Araneus ventricosus]
MSYIKRYYGDEVTVVFDGYIESSVNTKVIERQRRRMKCTSREIIFNESTVLLDPQRQFLINLTALTPDYTDILMLKESKGKDKDRFYSSKDLQNSNLVIECTHKKIHSLRSCD